MISNSNFKDFNSVGGDNLNSVHELISTYGMEAMPQAMEILFNEAMRLEREQHLGAGHYERLDYANGYKPKRVKTRIGNLDLSIPQTRDSDFYPNCLEKGLRSERALSIALGEMYINGVSTRKVTNIVEAMCGFEVSAQMVSNASKELDASLEAWRNRSLGQMDYLLVDARYEQVRVDGLVRDCAVLIAIGINPQGKREVLGTQVSLSEAEVHWREFFKDLQKRGLHGVKLLVSDAHHGIKAARKAIIPNVSSICNKMHKAMWLNKVKRVKLPVTFVQSLMQPVKMMPSVNLICLLSVTKSRCLSSVSGLKITFLRV